MPWNIFSSSPKISDDFFLVIYPNFSLFYISFHIRHLDAPPVLHRALETTFSSSLFSHLPTFVYENWPLECPLRWMPGAVAPSAPPSAHHCIHPAIVPIVPITSYGYSIRAIPPPHPH